MLVDCSAHLYACVGSILCLCYSLVSFKYLLHCALAAAQCIVIGPVCGFVWVCYHDYSKLRASIFTKLGLWVNVVTISSWLNFDRPASPGRGSAAGRKFLAPPYYSQRAVFAYRWAVFFSFLLALHYCIKGKAYVGSSGNINVLCWPFAPPSYCCYSNFVADLSVALYIVYCCTYKCERLGSLTRACT